MSRCGVNLHDLPFHGGSWRLNSFWFTPSAVFDISELNVISPGQIPSIINKSTSLPSRCIKQKTRFPIKKQPSHNSQLILFFSKYRVWKIKINAYSTLFNQNLQHCISVHIWHLTIHTVQKALIFPILHAWHKFCTISIIFFYVKMQPFPDPIRKTIKND